MKREWVPLFAAVSTSRKLSRLKSHAHRLFYTWLLPQCDAWGRIQADAQVLNAKVWPLLRMTEDQTDAAIRDCESLGLLVVLEFPGYEPWIQLPDWDQKAGKIGQLKRDRGSSEFPDEGKPRLGLGNPSQTEQTEQKEKSRANARARASSGKEQRDPHLWSVILPEFPHLDSPKARLALTEWGDYATARGLEPAVAMAWRKRFGQFAGMTGDALVAGINESIASGKWTSFFPPKNGYGSRTRLDAYPEM